MMTWITPRGAPLWQRWVRIGWLLLLLAFVGCSSRESGGPAGDAGSGGGRGGAPPEYVSAFPDFEDGYEPDMGEGGGSGGVGPESVVEVEAEPPLQLAAREGDRLYAGSLSGVTVASVVEAPLAELGRTQLGGVRSLHVEGGYVFAIVPDDVVPASLVVLDARDPTDITPVAERRLPGKLEGAVRSAGHLLVAVSSVERTATEVRTRTTLQSFSLDVPAGLDVVGEWSLTSEVAPLHETIRHVIRLATPRTEVFVQEPGGARRLRHVAVELGADGILTPRATELPPPDESVEPRQIRVLSGAGDAIFMLTPDGVTAFDTANTSAPSQPSSVVSIAGPDIETLAGDLLFVATAQRLHVIDVSDPAALSDLWQFDLPERPGNLLTTSAGVLVQWMAGASCANPSTVGLFSIDRADLRLMDTTDVDVSTCLEGLWTDGGDSIVMTSHWQVAELRVGSGSVDAAAPAIDMPGDRQLARGFTSVLFAPDETLYVGATTIHRVLQPFGTPRMEHLATAVRAQALASAGSNVCRLTDRSLEVTRADRVSDPSPDGSVELTIAARPWVTGLESHVLVPTAAESRTWASSLTSVDVSNPSAPEVAGQLELSLAPVAGETVRDLGEPVRLGDRLIFQRTLLDEAAVLDVFDVSQPEALRYLEPIERTPGVVYDAPTRVADALGSTRAAVVSDASSDVSFFLDRWQADTLEPLEPVNVPGSLVGADASGDWLVFEDYQVDDSAVTTEAECLAQPAPSRLDPDSGRCETFRKHVHLVELDAAGAWIIATAELPQDGAVLHTAVSDDRVFVVQSLDWKALEDGTRHGFRLLVLVGMSEGRLEVAGRLEYEGMFGRPPFVIDAHRLGDNAERYLRIFVADDPSAPALVDFDVYGIEGRTTSWDADCRDPLVLDDRLACASSLGVFDVQLPRQ